MNNFTSIFIKRPVFATTISLLILILGLVCYTKLAIRQFPKIEANVISISTSYSGASAEDVESFITRPIEGAISGVDGVDYITSTSSAGQSVVTVNLKLNSDINAAMVDINSYLSSVLKSLPTGVDDPILSKTDPNGNADLVISFSSSNMNIAAITDYLTRVVQPQLSTLDGVGSANVWGMKTYAMRIWLNPKKMAALGVTSSQVETALNNNNIQTQAGEIDRASQIISINAKTDLVTPEEFSRLVIKANNGKLVRLNDIGHVELGINNDTVSLFVNGQETVGIGVTTKSTANPLEVAKAVKQTLKLIAPTIPPGVKVDIPYDSSLYIQDSISEVEHTVIMSSLVVFLVIFLFIGSLRSVLIPVVTIPLSIIGACMLMYALNYTINTLTLLAFVLAIGMVVDDAIVVLENIHRHIEAGETPIKAAMLGAKEISFAVIAMTITLAAVYTPIGFTSGLTGSLFREFAFTLAGAVVVSGFIALTLSPMMCSKIMKSSASLTKPISHSSGFKNRFNRLPQWIERVLHRFTQRYERYLTKALHARSTVLTIAVTILICGMIFFIPLKMKSVLAPDEDQGYIFGFITAPTAANIEYTTKNTDLLGNILSKQSSVGNYAMINGVQNGQNNAVSYVQLKNLSQRKINALQLIQTLVPLAQGIPGVTAMFFNPPSLPASRQIFPFQFVIKTTGSYEELNAVVEKIIAEASTHPGFLNVSTDLKLDKPELNVEINRDKASTLGVNMSDISTGLKMAYGQPQVTTFVKNGLSYDVIPQVDQLFRNNPDKLNLINVKSEDGKSIPLSTFVTLNNVVSPSSLVHFQQQRSATINAVLSKQYSTSEALDYFEQLTKKIIPPDMTYDFSGSTRQLVTESNSMLAVFVFAIILIFLVLSAQFESFRDPFIVMLSVPLSLVGALITLFFTGGSLNIYTEIGLVTLIGLISKHGILIVEFANQLQKKEGWSATQAVISAAVIRFRPILMTTASMVLGALPLVLARGAGAAARSQMGWVIMGGMCFGTVLTLFVVPTVYSLLAKRKLVEEKLDANSSTETV